jgi:uncharacterized protein
MWELLLPLLGFLVAVVASMAGVGGGVVFVPILALGYGFLPVHAVGTSLMVIIFGSISASIGFAWQKRIFYKTGLLLALATVPGSVVGAILASELPADVLGLAFGVFLVIVAIRMLWVNGVLRKNRIKQKMRKVIEHEGDLFLNKERLVAGVGLGFFGGLASGTLGVGGGILLVPIMALILLMPMHAVVATSMFTMVFTSLSGVFQHWTMGNVDFGYALLLVVGALVGAQVGAWLCKRTSGEKLSLIFAVLVLVVSVQMIIKFI